MPKLHELLAAESSVTAQHNIISGETVSVFNKPEHFLRSTTEISYFAEADQQLDTSETKAHVTSVDDRLEYSFGKAFVSYIDLLAQKDRTNAESRADVMINGKIFLNDLPATALLTLENRLAQKRDELKVIPTLQPGPVWVEDKQEGMWRTDEPRVTFRSKKTVRPIVMSPATEHHPAQITSVSEDIPVAKISQTVWSSMWTSQQKHDALSRLDELLIAIKKARQRANNAEICSIHVGKTIADFVLRGQGA